MGKEVYDAATVVDKAKDGYDLATDPGPQNPNKGLTPQEAKDAIDMVTDSPNIYIPFVNPWGLDGGHLPNAIDGMGKSRNQLEEVYERTK